MREGTAIELAKGKMKELGIQEGNYIIRYRHFRLDPLETRGIKGDNQHFVFIYPDFNMRVESKTGVFDMQDEGINELQHIHTGLIELKNQSNTRLDAIFIQIIPLENRQIVTQE